jgi:hypothetical protein
MQPVIAAAQEHQTTLKGTFGLIFGLSIEGVLPWLSAVVFVLTAINIALDLHKKWKNRGK